MSSYYWLVHEQLLKTVCQFSPPSSSSSWRQYHSKGAPLENQEAQKPRHSLLLFKTWWKKTNFSMAAQIQFLPSQTQICTILPIILLHFHNSSFDNICYYHIDSFHNIFWSRFNIIILSLWTDTSVWSIQVFINLVTFIRNKSPIRSQIRILFVLRSNGDNSSY